MQISGVPASSNKPCIANLLTPHSQLPLHRAFPTVQLTSFQRLSSPTTTDPTLLLLPLIHFRRRHQRDWRASEHVHARRRVLVPKAEVILLGSLNVLAWYMSKPLKESWAELLHDGRVLHALASTEDVGDHVPDITKASDFGANDLH